MLICFTNKANSSSQNLDVLLKVNLLSKSVCVSGTWIWTLHVFWDVTQNTFSYIIYIVYQNFTFFVLCIFILFTLLRWLNIYFITHFVLLSIHDFFYLSFFKFLFSIFFLIISNIFTTYVVVTLVLFCFANYFTFFF